MAYGKLARREGDPPALTYLLGFDSEPIRAEKALFDLAEWARAHPDLAALLGRLPPPRSPPRSTARRRPAWP
ncbi:MAG: hypothetical protein IPL60_12140 [Ardenticatenia bacterium]|nr:hypothetical protein [Ardenticatenia bacterium]